MRYKRLVRAISTAFDNKLPQYVVREALIGYLYHIVRLYNRKWNLEKIELGLEDFDLHTRKVIIERQFGDIELGYIWQDMERTMRQRRIAADEIPGTNEPIIIIQVEGGFELIEGWHRTMARLPRDGSKRLFKAWVGRYDTT